MSHVIKIEVEGLAGRADTVSFELHRDINVFFGANGSGKTSLLRILDSAFENDASSILNVPFQRAEVTLFSVDMDHEIKRTIEKPGDTTPSISISPPTSTSDALTTDRFNRFSISGIQSSVSVGSVLKWKTTPARISKQMSASGSLTRFYLPTIRAFWSSDPSTGIRAGFPSDDLPQKQDEWDRIFARRLEQNWINYANTMLGQVELIQSEGMARMLQAFLPVSSKRKAPASSDIGGEAAYILARNFIAEQISSVGPIQRKAFLRSYQSDEKLRTAVRSIVEIQDRMREVTSARDSLQATIADLYSGKTLIFRNDAIAVETDSGAVIPLSALSAGEKQLVDILLRNMLIEYSTIMIDEPENSLHIDWQRKLLTVMHELNPQSQIIMATHGPEIMAHIPDEKIFHL